MSEKTEEELKYEDLEDMFEDVCDLLSEVLDIVVSAGDLETMLEIEHLLEEREYPARQRDVTRKINQKYKDLESIRIIGNEEDE